MPKIIPVVTELDEPPIVGKYYLVPCVQDSVTGTWFPIIGPPHEDEEIFHIPEYHYHYDWRFMHGRLMKEYAGYKLHPEFNYIKVHRVEATCGQPELQRMKCVREGFEYPTGRPDGTPSSSFQALEKSYENATLKCKRCPHRGFDLRSMPVSADGVIVCPGHGLGWNAKTGKQVKRFQKTEEP